MIPNDGFKVRQQMFELCNEIPRSKKSNLIVC